MEIQDKHRHYPMLYLKRRNLLVHRRLKAKVGHRDCRMLLRLGIIGVFSSVAGERHELASWVGSVSNSSIPNSVECLEQDHFLISRFISRAHTLSYSSSVFHRVLAPSTFLWNTLIKSHCQKCFFSHTLSAFSRMKANGALPDSYTYPFVIKACSSMCKALEGKSVHGSAFRCGLDQDLYVGTSLIDMYGKYGEVGDARKVFDGMSQRNVVSWTAMVVGYAAAGDVGSWVGQPVTRPPTLTPPSMPFVLQTPNTKVSPVELPPASSQNLENSDREMVWDQLRSSSFK